MKIIIVLSVIIGFVMGLAAFIIIAIIDSVTIALQMGLLAAVLVGVGMGIVMTIDISAKNIKYLKYRDENISENIIYEAALFKLNGNKKDTGYLFLTDKTIIVVMIKGKTVLSEIKIPLVSITGISHKLDRHLPNILIIQSDGTETRFISDYDKLMNNLHPLVGDNVWQDNNLEE